MEQTFDNDGNESILLILMGTGKKRMGKWKCIYFETQPKDKAKWRNIINF
jgi:hypothetical protein